MDNQIHTHLFTLRVPLTELVDEVMNKIFLVLIDMGYLSFANELQITYN